jgi:hypothetical protein
MQPYRQGVGLRAGLAHNLIPLRGNAVAGAANATATLWVKKAKHTNVVEHPASFLPGFTHPAAASVFEPVWASLGIELNALDADGVDVLVDCGRIGIGLPAGLLDVATLVLLVGRSSLRSLAGLEAQLKSVTAARTAAEVGLLLVGPGRPYSVAEINKQFAVPVMATLPWSSDEAAVLSDGIFRFRHRRDTALGQAFIAVAAAIQKQARQRRELLHSETSEVTP